LEKILRATVYITNKSEVGDMPLDAERVES